MKYAIFLPALGKNGETWIYLFDDKGAPILFKTREAAAFVAETYSRALVVEYK